MVVGDDPTPVGAAWEGGTPSEVHGRALVLSAEARRTVKGLLIVAAIWAAVGLYFALTRPCRIGWHRRRHWRWPDRRS